MAVPPLLKILASEETCVNILRKACWEEGVVALMLEQKVIKWGNYRKLYQR
ncbi:MAG: hypothetical protein RMK18_10530 [Armatimonadota bacterium]|nr:hypothetical protein [Armatimonadota bacterium]MDW8026281.1 hypothetical protein [Armatimonadota bacterium]